MLKMLHFDVAYGLWSRYLPKFPRKRGQYSEITALESARPAIMDDLVAIADIRSVGRGKEMWMQTNSAQGTAPPCNVPSNTKNTPYSAVHMCIWRSLGDHRTLTSSLPAMCSPT